MYIFEMKFEFGFLKRFIDMELEFGEARSEIDQTSTQNWTHEI